LGDTHSLSDSFLNCGGEIPSVLRMISLLAITGKTTSKVAVLSPNYHPEISSTFSAGLLLMIFSSIHHQCVVKARSIQFYSNRPWAEKKSCGCEVCGKKN